MNMVQQQVSPLLGTFRSAACMENRECKRSPLHCLLAQVSKFDKHQYYQMRYENSMKPEYYKLVTIVTHGKSKPGRNPLSKRNTEKKRPSQPCDVKQMCFSRPFRFTWTYAVFASWLYLALSKISIHGHPTNHQVLSFLSIFLVHILFENNYSGL